MAVRRRPAELAEHTLGNVLARETQRVLVWAWPWVGLVLVLVAGVASHKSWPGAAGAFAVTAGTLFLALLFVSLTHHRRGFGRWFAALTTMAAGLWLAWVTADGVGRGTPQLHAWLYGGVTLAIGWSAWLHIHEGGDEAGLSRPFAKAIAKARMEGLRLIKIRKVDEHKTEAEIDHPGWEHKDVAASVGAIEASWPKPIAPGTIVATRNADDARRTRVIFADPRSLNRIHAWPGPSAPGASIAEPIVTGVWQDATPHRYKAFGYHEQVMAMTGAGKTLGCMYSELGEVITRKDSFVVAVDLMKRRQFFGPMEPALHYLATTPEQFRALLDAVNGSLPERTDYLGRKYLGNWEENCGLMHGSLWLEEAADAFEAIDDSLEETLFPLIRAARSAGWRIVYSLHRASFDQMPTFLKDMVAMTTMGVRNASHARFGLSSQQYEADSCHPEDWADNPEDRGKFYRDAPVLAKAYRTMAGRYFSWGSDTRLMAAHAARYPAGERPIDGVTLPFFAPLIDAQRQAGKPAPAGTGASRPSTTLMHKEGSTMTMPDEDDDWPGPDLESETGGIELDDEEAELPIGRDVLTEPTVKASPEVALEAVRRQIHQWRMTGVPNRKPGQDARWFANRDLYPLVASVGRVRTWSYLVLPRLVAEHEIRRDGDGWRILDKAA